MSRVHTRFQKCRCKTRKYRSPCSSAQAKILSSSWWNDCQNTIWQRKKKRAFVYATLGHEMQVQGLGQAFFFSSRHVGPHFSRMTGIARLGHVLNHESHQFDYGYFLSHQPMPRSQQGTHLKNNYSRQTFQVFAHSIILFQIYRIMAH